MNLIGLEEEEEEEEEEGNLLVFKKCEIHGALLVNLHMYFHRIAVYLQKHLVQLSCIST